MTDSRDIETVERVIPAPPEKIFALLADPSRHQDIDGSGFVRDAKEPSQRVKLGDKFGMAMKRGVPYSTVNTVIEFEDNRRIAWKTCSPGVVGKVRGGPIWRYELEPVDGGTRARELGHLAGGRHQVHAAELAAHSTRASRWRRPSRTSRSSSSEPA